MSIRDSRLLIAVLLVCALAACAVPMSIPFGASEADVRHSLGRPTAVSDLGDGGKRLMYSGQPFLQEAWAIDIDGHDKVTRVEQVLADEVFARIKPGKDTRATIARDFGPAAEPYQFPLVKQTAWMYRYKLQGGFDAAMFIYFDADGVVVRSESGLDPWMIRGSDHG